MSDLTELKEIWMSADTSGMPAYSEIMQVISRYRRKALAKKLAVMAAAMILVGVMMSIVFFYKPELLTTRVGALLIIIAGMQLVAGNIRSLRRLYDVKNHTNKEFAAYLAQVQKNRLHYYKRTQVLGLSLSFAGLLLYVYEAVYTHLLWSIVTYSLLIIYFCIVWFFIRLRAYRRQAAKLQETLKKITHLEQQF